MIKDPSKFCSDTGEKVLATLREENLILPMNPNAYSVSREKKIAKLEKLFGEIIDTLGYDRSDEELQDTPKRIAKMWVDDLYVAWDPKQFPKCTSFDNKGTGSFEDEMVIVNDIHVTSTCAHHFIVTDIIVDVGYVADKKMIGISKINKIVKHLAKNPTSQETLGKAIARAISIVTESQDVAVRIRGRHYCVIARGANDVNSVTTTFAALGKFAERNSNLRSEFNAAINNK